MRSIPVPRHVILGLLISTTACLTEESDSCNERDDALSRDQCIYEQIRALEPTDIAQAHQLASTIQDPIVQGAAVTSWVRDHGQLSPQSEGVKLCNLLDVREAGVCRRHLASAHLQR